MTTDNEKLGSNASTDKVETHIELEHKSAMKLTANGKAQEDYYDDSCPGLVLRVTKGGKRTLAHLYSFGGKRHWLVLGRFPHEIGIAKARDKVYLQRVGLRDGVDPKVAREKARIDDANNEHAKMTMTGLVQRRGEHMEEHKTHRDLKGLMARYKNHVLPVTLHKNTTVTIGELLQKDFDRSHYHRIMDVIGATEQWTAARHVEAALKGLMSFAKDKGIRSDNPIDGVNWDGWPPEEELDEDDPDLFKDHRGLLVLQPRELKIIWHALPGMHPLKHFVEIVRLCMILGQRCKQICCLRKDWISKNEDGQMIITFPAWVMKAKNKSARKFVLPVPAMAAKIIEKLEPQGPQGLFFPNKNGTPTNVTRISNLVQELQPKFAALGVRHWRMHDLRRTMSGLAKRDEHEQQLALLDKHAALVLNHASAKKEEGKKQQDGDAQRKESYIDSKKLANSFIKEKAKALNQWAAFLALVLGIGANDDAPALGSNVVDLAAISTEQLEAVLAARKAAA